MNNYGLMVTEIHQLVGDFIRKFNLTDKPESFWNKLITEETGEYNEALDDMRLYNQPEYDANVLKENADVVYVLSGLFHSTKSSSLKRHLVSVTFPEWLLEKNFNMEAFRRVHQSNMSKLDDNGEPIYNENGKVMKGPNYRPPDLSDLI